LCNDSVAVSGTINARRIWLLRSLLFTPPLMLVLMLMLLRPGRGIGHRSFPECDDDVAVSGTIIARQNSLLRFLSLFAPPLMLVLLLLLLLRLGSSVGRCSSPLRGDDGIAVGTIIARRISLLCSLLSFALLLQLQLLRLFVLLLPRPSSAAGLRGSTLYDDDVAAIGTINALRISLLRLLSFAPPLMLVLVVVLLLLLPLLLPLLMLVLLLRQGSSVNYRSSSLCDDGVAAVGTILARRISLPRSLPFALPLLLLLLMLMLLLLLLLLLLFVLLLFVLRLRLGSTVRHRGSTLCNDSVAAVHGTRTIFARRISLPCPLFFAPPLMLVLLLLLPVPVPVLLRLRLRLRLDSSVGRRGSSLLGNDGVVAAVGTRTINARGISLPRSSFFVLLLLLLVLALALVL
jgi:hypothetical protein